MNPLFIFLAALVSLSANAADSPPCSVAKVEASGIGEIVAERGKAAPVTIENNGNAFAVRKNLLLGAYHTLAPGSNTVTLSIHTDQGNVISTRGEVVAKDFHTDLALIRPIGEENLTPCTFSPARIEVGQKVTIFGFRKENKNLTSYTAAIQENLSGNLAVPGYSEALEFQVGFPAESLSGSPIMQGGRVIGVVNAESRGLILAPNTKEVQLAFEELLRGYLKQTVRNGVYELSRNYTYNARNRSIQFSGLEIRENDQTPILVAEGTPHRAVPETDPNDTVVAEGTQHRRHTNRGDLFGREYDVVPVASMRTNLGYVVARISPDGLVKLKVDHPELAQRIADAGASRIAIISVNGQPTPNVLELLRALAKAQGPYSIAATVPTPARATDTRSNLSPFEESIRDVQLLVDSLSPKLEDAALAFTLREQMGQFRAKLAQLDHQWKTNRQKVDSRLLDEARSAWERMEDSVSGNGVLFRATTSLRMTTDERHWRDGIRSRPPVIN